MREEAMEEVMILQQIQREVRERLRYLSSMIREEQTRITAQELEDMEVFDWTEDLEWMQEYQTVYRIPSPRRKYRNHADEWERLFQNGLATRLMVRTNGARWIEDHLGIPHSTAHRWSTRYVMDWSYRPWHNIRKGTSVKFSYEDINLIRESLMSDPRMVNKEVNAPQVLQILQEVWAHHHPGQAFPEMSLQTVRRMMSRWGWSWRRAHKRRRPGVDPDAAIWFVFRVLHLFAEGVQSCDILNADETAFLLYPQGHYTWARRGCDAVQIHAWRATKSSPIQ